MGDPKRTKGRVSGLTGVGFWLIAGVFLACAGSSSRCGHGPATTSAVSGASGEVSAGESGGEATSPLARAIDADLRPLLGGIYGSVTLSGETRSEGEGETIYDLRYTLGRAHGEADGDALEDGLRSRDYDVDRALIDERGASIFAHGRGADLTLQIDVGATTLAVSIAAGR